MTPHGRLASDTSPRTANRIQRANLASKGQSRLPLLSVPLFFNPDPADLLRFLVNDPAAGQGAVVVLCRFRPIADSDSDGRGQQQTSINTALPPASELALSATAGGDRERGGQRCREALRLRPKLRLSVRQLRAHVRGRQDGLDHVANPAGNRRRKALSAIIGMTVRFRSE
jgi:hypothetical protein